MRTFLILAALGWAISLPWAALFGYCALIVAALAAAWLLSVSIERHSALPRRGGNVIDANYVTALEAMVSEAEAEMKTLRGEIERLRAAQPISEPDPTTALYHRVGLSSCAPDWLVLAARRAYRVALHPDKHPPHRKQEAGRRFQQAEIVFEAIVTQRASA